MGKKKKHPEHENLERWLVSYADFITLLFATFTALYAIATAKLTEVEDVGKAIQEGFEQQSAESVLKGISSVLQGKSTPTDHPNPAFEETGKGEGVIGKHDSMTFMPGEIKALEALMEELTAAAEEANKELSLGNTAPVSPPTELAEEPPLTPTFSPSEGPPAGPTRTVLKGVELTLQERGVRISFDSSLLFAPASAQLAAGHTRLLDTISNRLVARMGDHLVYVEGHTDSQPIHSAVYPSNWELSAARAATVVRRLIGQHRMSPERLVAVGYGDTRAISTNATPEGRAKNRRIDIIIYSKLEAMKADAGMQFRKEHMLLKAPVVEQNVQKPKTQSKSSENSKILGNNAEVKPSAQKVSGAVPVRFESLPEPIALPEEEASSKKTPSPKTPSTPLRTVLKTKSNGGKASPENKTVSLKAPVPNAIVPNTEG